MLLQVSKDSCPLPFPSLLAMAKWVFYSFTVPQYNNAVFLIGIIKSQFLDNFFDFIPNDG